MKKFILSIATVCMLLLMGCNNDEIIPSKPGEALQPVEELQYDLAEPNIRLSWQLPASFSADIIQPVSVQVKILVDGQNAGTHVLPDSPESYTYSPSDPSKEYRFTVKVMAEVDAENPNISNLRYSLGKTVAF